MYLLGTFCLPTPSPVSSGQYSGSQSRSPTCEVVLKSSPCVDSELHLSPSATLGPLAASTQACAIPLAPDPSHCKSPQVAATFCASVSKLPYYSIFKLPARLLSSSWRQTGQGTNPGGMWSPRVWIDASGEASLDRRSESISATTGCRRLGS